ncbi:MAG: hypothetical protein EOP05_06110 [Proteobacteria bacterium]|nr:MAG: hypothetical protein EOP05_06110 [Pseudomonadota bacterium]
MSRALLVRNLILCVVMSLLAGLCFERGEAAVRKDIGGAAHAASRVTASGSLEFEQMHVKLPTVRMLVGELIRLSPQRLRDGTRLTINLKVEKTGSTASRSDESLVTEINIVALRPTGEQLSKTQKINSVAKELIVIQLEDFANSTLKLRLQTL